MNYAISNIAEIISGIFLQKKSDEFVDNIIIDSRRVVFPASSIFFAMPGSTRSGVDFIMDLYLQGVNNFVVDPSYSKDDMKALPKANIIIVENVLGALQQLATFHRQQFHLPVIGITGSNGKTIIKEWLYQLLQSDFNIVRSPKSYNSKIGVPLSLCQINEKHTLGIFEAGISQTGEMKILQPMIQPEIGVLGFMGEAHAEGFESMEQKITEKLILFKEVKQLVYCSDNNKVNEAVLHYKTYQHPKVELFSWGKNDKATLFIKDIVKLASYSVVYLKYKNVETECNIPFVDDASLYNVLTCMAICVALQKDLEMILQKIQGLHPIAMRLELKKGNHQCNIINDSYSSDLDSLAIALDFLAQQNVYQKKTVILSDLLQSGMQDEVLYSKIASILKTKSIDRLIAIGSKMKRYAAFFDFMDNKSFFESTELFLSKLNQISFREETILLKGARMFAFEKISYLLEQKTHDTILEINLNALSHNLKTYRQLLKKEVGIMVMVKAFSYGSGSSEIAHLLQQEGVEYLAVAYADEGVELRKSGIHLPIMVMNTSETGYENVIQYQLEPELFSYNSYISFKSFLQSKGIAQYPVHLKLDTGMHRLGFMENELLSILDDLKTNSIFKVKSIFSHLAASENPEQDSFTQMQGHRFNEMVLAIEKNLRYNPVKHLSNTSGIHRHPNLQFDMVRLGIGLYGVDTHLSLQNVTTLKTTIAQIKNIQAGESVGYGRKTILKKDTVIATVRIGYADGFPRSMGNGVGKMLVNGALAPVVGSVCMDMTMIDISGITASEGDEVIVFGKDLSVIQLASWGKTIPYEILTNISQRVKRVYFQE